MVKSKISALSWVLFLCLSRAVPAADTGAALPGVLGMKSMEITDQDSRDLVKDGAAAVPSASEYQSAIEKYRQAVRATETNQGSWLRLCSPKMTRLMCSAWVNDATAP